MYGRDLKNGLSKNEIDRNAPGKDLNEIMDSKGRPILTDLDMEQANTYRENLNLGIVENNTFQPSKTMIRSLDELY